MTFYNIIFGILFVGAVREIFASLALPEGQRAVAFWNSVVLTLMIFSDVVYTSHVIEELKRPYGVWLKLLDLLSFIILTLALISLDPTANNVLQLSIEPAFSNVVGLPAPLWVFWLLLTFYWLLVVLWVRVGEVHPDEQEFKSIKGDPAMAGHVLISSSRAESVTWFLIKWGRALGLVLLAGITLTAYVWPGWLLWLSPLMAFLAIFYLVISGFILNLYKPAHV